MNAQPPTAPLRQELEDLLQCFHLMPVAVARFSAAGAVEMLNPRAVQLLEDLGVDCGRTDGPAILDALCPGLAAGWGASAGAGGPRRSSLRRHDGRSLHLLLRWLRPEARWTMLVIEDITHTIEPASDAAGQALLGEIQTDPLTGLFNRRGLALRAAAMPAQTAAPTAGRPNPAWPAWVVLDIDHLKQVNDTYGQDTGDAVLKALATAMQAGAREGDTLARLGGGAFVLRLPAANDVIARRVAERLRLNVQALAIPVGRHAVHVTASFGVTLQGAEEDWTQALERAHAALSEAKHGGRNRVVLATLAAG